jgi:plastocyanin
MRKRSIIFLSLVLALIAGVGSYLVASNRRIVNNHLSRENVSESHIQLFATKAVPDAIILKVGETATFASADSSSHSLSLGGGAHGLSVGNGKDGHTHQHIGDFSSGEFANDEAWRATFRAAGTYELHDHLHPEVRITVIAYQPQ